MKRVAHQAACVKVWQALEDARQLVAGTRDAFLMPNPRDAFPGALTPDSICTQIAELRDFVFSQMGTLE